MAMKAFLEACKAQREAKCVVNSIVVVQLATGIAQALCPKEFEESGGKFSRRTLRGVLNRELGWSWRSDPTYCLTTFSLPRIQIEVHLLEV
jgi:hypothetical protein